MASRLIFWLQELPDSASDPIAVVGGKGANLGRLLSAGFPVPPGFVITTDAYHLFLDSDTDRDASGETRRHSAEAPGKIATGDADNPVNLASLDDDPIRLRERLLHDPFPDALRVAILDAYARLGQPSVAVRSSGTAEDLAGASFAGQHDTVLDVQEPQALLDAVRVCWASLWSARAVAYREQRDWSDEREKSDRMTPWAPDVLQAADPVALAVVVQRMVPAEVAGVAFTANPLTGDRSETTISAVRGLGERLVSGEVIADEWVVRNTRSREQASQKGAPQKGTPQKGALQEESAGMEAICLRAAEGVLRQEQALAVAAMARRIAAQFGAPQDVEWAIADDALFVLQARPMTALPDPITWTAPAAGGWMRNFRLGEWLPEPMTPLFESWLLARLEESELAAEARDFTLHPLPPYHINVNGWYFTSPIGGGVSPRNALGALLRHPLRIAALALSLTRPEVAEPILLAPLAKQWRERLLPHYQSLVTTGQRQVADASPLELIHLIDMVAEVAGDYLWTFSVVGGNAWKTEQALARFYQRRLLPQVRRSHQELLLGLPTTFQQTPAHAVQSLDWVRPTLGELSSEPERAQATDAVADVAEARRRRLEETRLAAEATCRAALSAKPRQRRRFEKLLELAQRYARLREEQAGWFTLGWPLLRHAVLRLGEELRGRGAIEQRDDVFFLTRQELVAALDTGAESQSPYAPGARDLPDLRAFVAERRQAWERQRRLSPPLTLGKPPGASLLASAVEAMRTPMVEIVVGETASETLTGMPASPGRATGPARLILSPDDFARVRSGDVLVAQVTAPAWTPLFERVVAVVTDGGSLAAHASLVAREYGIPAVVGTGDATIRLHDGQLITVDGSAGIVELVERLT